MNIVKDFLKLLRPARPDKAEVFKDANNEWRWRRLAPNGQIVSVVGEGYKRRGYCIHMAVTKNPGCPLILA